MKGNNEEELIKEGNNQDEKEEYFEEELIKEGNQYSLMSFSDSSFSSWSFPSLMSSSSKIFDQDEKEEYFEEELIKEGNDQDEKEESEKLINS